MGVLSRDLRDLGYSRTEQQSPFHENGELWTKGYELVCDETGTVIRSGGDSSFQQDDDNEDSDEVYRYYNSNTVRMPGGYVGSYDWGRDEETGTFLYTDD